MMLKFILLAYMVQSAIAAPQLLTFRDGKFGVNFGGYHAEAGLGGLLTGDSAHGGLSASAGTPYGQKAAAGLGGSAGGNAAGLLYAGAEANPHTGASAILGGDTSKGGYGGSVAYADGKVVSNTKVLPNALNNQVDTVTSAPSNVKSSDESGETYIQKVRPPKKYLIKPSYAAQVAASANANANSNANVNTNSNAGVNIAHSKH
ncbi:uncharacterized protein LOC118756914, partial [Rhagoletis pomonella]|uniref:uncharacterized protein LOC118756914 n=1 Tax=Rhagoletis pomonella TaxID=28610 RepID=UPI001780851E